MATRSRKRDAKGHVDPFYQRRERYRAALEPLGLWEAFAAMPRWVQESYWVHKWPDPLVEFDEATAPNDVALAREHMNAWLRKAMFEFDGVAMHVRDCFSIIGACLGSVRGTDPAGMPQSVLTFLALARPVLERWSTVAVPRMYEALMTSLANQVAANSRIDRQMWAFDPQVRKLDAYKLTSRFVVRGIDPQVRDVSLDGASRPMYRLAMIAGIGETPWLSWTGAQLGRADGEAERPVYVQAHALRNLHERVNLPAAAPYLHTWLGVSLKDPNIVVREPGGDLLVEFRLRDRRIGYLVVTPLADLIAVRTFLFLTMEGTPEARKLKRYLKLTRRDVDWLGLSDLAAFTQTDLRHDPVLRPMFERCGCGHLFEMEYVDYAPQPKPFAAEVRRYLRLAA